MGAMLFTQDGTSVEVEQVWVVSQRQDAEGRWVQMGGKVALLPNGVYCHGDGNLLPFESVEEIRETFMSLDKAGESMVLPEMQWLLDAMLEWFENRNMIEGKVIQKVSFNRQGFPELEDGSPAEEQDIYEYFEPGPALTAAIVGMSKRREADAVAAKAAKPSIYQPAPPPGKPRVAGEPVATKKTGGAPKGRPLTRAQLAQKRATAAANKAAKAAKATPNPTPAVEQSASMG